MEIANQYIREIAFAAQIYGAKTTVCSQCQKCASAGPLAAAADRYRPISDNVSGNGYRVIDRDIET